MGGHVSGRQGICGVFWWIFGFEIRNFHPPGFHVILYRDLPPFDKNAMKQSSPKIWSGKSRQNESIIFENKTLQKHIGGCHSIFL